MSGLRIVAAISTGNCNCSLRSKRNCKSSVWRRMAWDARGLRGSAFRGRVSPGSTKRTNRDFPLAVAETVPCTACWVVLCSPKVIDRCFMADKTELWRQVNRPWRWATEQPFRMWWSLAGFPQRIQAGSTWQSPHLRRLVAVGAVSVVAWRAKRSSASLQLWMSCCHEKSWCMWFVQSINFPCNWSFRKCSSCSATSMSRMYYRKRGSTSHTVRQWLLWVVEREERERERERDACDVIDITLKSRVIMHMITSTACRPYASTRSEPVEFSSACTDKELGAWALEQQGRVIDEWRSGRGSFAFASQPAVDHPAAFFGMLQARRIDQVDVYYYRKRGSASYIVRQWLLWVVVERERETPVTSSISCWNREWSCIWLPRRRVDPTRWRVLSLSSSRVHVKTRSLALERSSSRVEWLMNDDREGEALRSLVSLPWTTQQHFLACFKQEE